jgi:prevent-host-death family protein
MHEAQSSDVKARLPHYLDAVERGETIVITRHGRPVAHLVPAPAAEKDRVHKALAGIAALRKSAGKMPLADILSARHAGHKY